VELLDEKQAAQRLNLSPKTLQKWRLTGGGPVYLKLGTAVRYREVDLDAWLDARTRTSTSGLGQEVS